MVDKRRFTRIELNVPGTLSHEDSQIAVSISDVSLTGIRLLAPESALSHLTFDSPIPYTAKFKTNDDSPIIPLHIKQH